MRRSWFIVPLVLLAVFAVYWRSRARSRSFPEAYVGERSATLWSSLAQVKQQVATLRYGEKVAVLDSKGEQAEVRTAEGLRGWLEARLLMDPALWQRSGQLLVGTRAMPVQARGRTKVSSNVRIEPGRGAARIYQFPRGAAVEVLSRAAAESSASAEEGQPAAKQTSAEEQKPRREDWLLVRGAASGGPGPGGIQAAAKEEEKITIAGWVLARFVELDLPGPVRDYAASAGLRVVAWFELNRVPDPGGEKPQYLVAGVRGGEGQACDFTLIRVYTWGATRQRYETAYVESEFCGYLPIRAGKAPGRGDPEFRFTALGKTGKEERLYRMRQTVVRRVRGAERQ
jgi:hypothetical protein